MGHHEEEEKPLIRFRWMAWLPAVQLEAFVLTHSM